MLGKVQRLDIHCPYKVWHSIIIARCLSRIPPYSSNVCKPILFSNFGEARSASVFCRASGEQHFNSYVLMKLNSTFLILSMAVFVSICVF